MNLKLRKHQETTFDAESLSYLNNLPRKYIDIHWKLKEFKLDHKTIEEIFSEQLRDLPIKGVIKM